MKNYKDIQGWFDYENVFDFLLNSMPQDGVFVECGAWLGKSSAYLCDKATTQNIYIVDSWKGSPDELSTFHKLATQVDIYEIFLENMGNRKFTPIRMLSVDAVNEFEDESIDVAFIDMSHDYDNVKQDIEIWYPKVKHGGYIAGHDYQHGWPGVVRAVNEFFSKVDNMSGCWVHQKIKV